VNGQPNRMLDTQPPCFSRKFAELLIIACTGMKRRMAEDGAFKGTDVGFAVGPALTRITLFGDFEVHAPDGSPIPIANRRARAILAMISVDPERPIARETLMKLLWPGRFEAQARASLRQCLLELGKLLEASGCAILSVSRDRVGLLPDSIQTDLGDLDHALTVGDVELANSVLHAISVKPLLDQMHISDGFDAWVKSAREECDGRISAKIADAVAVLQRAGNKATAAKLNEAWSIRERPKGTATAPVIQERTRIAVLPFHAIGAGDGSDYFADGIVDELISTLGQVPQLLIAGRTSSFHFRDSKLPPPEIASALGVSHLIEGSVQRQGERVRIHIRLIDGENGFELSGQRFDGTLDDVFALQETVAQAVTAAIGTALGVAMQPPLVHGLTHSHEAYDLYLQSKALSYNMFGNGALDSAVKLLDMAVALDPDFAEAWLLKGEVHQLIAIYTACLDRPAQSAQMAESVERALAINPNLGQAYSLLGFHQMVNNDFVGGLDLAFKGYQLEPNNPQVAMRLGSYLIFCGLTENGMRYVEEALAQDPVDGRKYLLRGCGHFNRGNIDAAVTDLQRSVDLGFPSIPLAVVTAAKGQHALAVELYMQTRLLMNKSIFPPAGTTPMTPEVMDAYWLVAAKGVCSGVSEDRETYCRTLDFVHMTMYDKGDMSIAAPAVFMGYIDMLFKTLGEKISPPNITALMYIWADVDPIRQIWQHEEFIPFAQRIGMAAAWDKYGWPDLLPVPSNR
jgi:TolB-like protein/Flp pilus assembly protein TadD